MHPDKLQMDSEAEKNKTQQAFRGIFFFFFSSGRKKQDPAGLPRYLEFMCSKYMPS